MPRQSIEDLVLPLAGFRVDRRTDDPFGEVKFEDLPSCKAEDERRIRATKTFERQGLGGRKMRRAARLLGLYLDAALADPNLRLSAASRVIMRAWRIRVCGWLWSLVDPLGSDEWVYFTVALPNWWVSSAELKNMSAKGLKKKLHAALYRAGAGESSGWLYAMIHGEFDGDTRGVPVHFHGIATKGMIKVLRKLRKQRQFHPNGSDRAKYPQVSIAKKLEIDKPWGFLPAGITYTSKSIWLQHNSRVEEDGKRRRFGKKHRIANVKHLVRLLLWLHDQPVKDQVLLIHLSVINGELVESKRGDGSPR